MKSKAFSATFSLSANKTMVTGDEAEAHYCTTGRLCWIGTPALQSPRMDGAGLCCEGVSGLYWVAG